MLKDCEEGGQISLNTCAVRPGPLMTIIFHFYIETTISVTITRQN